MFTVNYRITTDKNYIKTLSSQSFDSDGDIEGFLEIDFNGHGYGYYHNRPLHDGEEGSELLTNWFVSLLNAYLVLQNSDYVAISDIDSYNAWIELKRDSQNFLASILKAEKGNGSSYIAINPILNYTYGEWNNIKFNLKEFRDEVILKSLSYQNELLKINPSLSESNRFLELKQLITKATE